MAPPPIDYSKWDTLEVSSEDEDYNIRRRKAHLTRFENPQSITFGKNASVSSRPSEFLKSSSFVSGNSSTPANAANESPKLEAPNRTRLTVDESVVRNGGIHENKYFWKQDRYTVTAFVVLPSACKSIKSKDIVLNISEKSLHIKLRIGEKIKLDTTLFDAAKFCTQNDYSLLLGEFPYSIQENEELCFWELKDCNFSWQSLAENCSVWSFNDFVSVSMSNFGEVKNNVEISDSADNIGFSGTVIELSVKKKTLIVDAFVWWNCFLKGDTQINVEKIPDRLGAVMGASEKPVRQTTLFQKEWEQAHALFKEKIARNEIGNHIQLEE